MRKIINYCVSVCPIYSSSGITDSRVGSDQVDLREDLSSEQGGTGSASGSSLSASAYRGMLKVNYNSTSAQNID